MYLFISCPVTCDVFWYVFMTLLYIFFVCFIATTLLWNNDVILVLLSVS